MTSRSEEFYKKYPNLDPNKENDPANIGNIMSEEERKARQQIPDHIRQIIEREIKEILWAHGIETIRITIPTFTRMQPTTISIETSGGILELAPDISR